MLPGANASSALGAAEAVDAPVFVSEDAYAALSLSARWLRRAPAVAGAARQDTRDAGEAGAPVRAPQPRAYTARAALPRADASTQCHSSLTWEEHAWYLRACLPDVAARLTPEELERVRQLAGVVAAEQAAYVQERVASAADEEALRYFHPDVAAQVKAVLTRRQQRLQLQPLHREQHATLSLDAAHAAPALHHMQLLATRGCSRLMHSLPLGAHIPTAAPPGDAAADGKPAHAPVSADATCAALAASEGARVVMSSGAFCCLTDVLPGRAWELPVTVRAHAAADSEAAAPPPTVYVDSPLLAQRLSLRTKNEIFYKHAVLQQALKGDAYEQAHQYRLWRLGATRLLVRCREHALLPAPLPGAAPVSAVVRAKLEYAPQCGWEARAEVTARERARWWAALQLRPGATLVVCRVGVHDSALLAMERRDMAAVLADADSAPGTRFMPAESLSQLHQAMSFLQALPEGSYVLRRDAGERGVIHCLRTPGDAGADATLTDAAREEQVVRAAAGATDVEHLDFVPRRWQAAQPGAQQIPFTHPPQGLPGAVPRRQARQQALLRAGAGAPCGTPVPHVVHQGAVPRRSTVRYCYAFAEGRTCRVGERCQYPHISLAEVERLTRLAPDGGSAADAATGAAASGTYLASLQDYVAKRQRRHT